MFNTLRKFFGRRRGATLDTSGEFDLAGPASAPPTGSPRSVRVDAQPAQFTHPGNIPATIGVPLKSIIVRLPPDLMQRVRLLDVGDAEVFIPTQKILSQITSGAVRLSFGELRQISPPGTFTPENERDRTLVELPLQEILARLNPGFFMRRPAQKHVEIPPEVVGPFGGQTKITISTAAAKPAAPVIPIVRQRPPTGPGIPPPLRTQPPLVAPVQPGQRVQPETVPASLPPRLQPPVAPLHQPIFARIRPASPVPPSLPEQPVAVPAAPEFVEEAPFNDTNRFAPAAPVLPPIFSPIATAPEPAQSGDTDVIQMRETYSQPPPAYGEAPPVAAPITPIAPVAEPEPEPIRFSAPPPEPVVPVTSGETRFITVAVAELTDSWPEAVRNEITGHKLSSSWIGLPLGAVEGVIKTGKVAFPWKALRSWVKPPTPAVPSPYDTTMLELPLKIVTPLFLSELKATRTQKRYSLDDDIPDLFFNSQPAEAAVSLPAPPLPPTPAPAIVPPPVAPTPALPIQAPPAIPAFPAVAESARPADTNYFVWKGNAQGTPAEPEPAEEAPVFVKKGATTPGTAFLNRYATPNEIVSKAAALEGVDGALIALPDGLLVASRIPTNMNADTIAAFLPQIFGRVSQCTRELRLGELNNLNFTVGNIPWKIFRVGSIYFAAFGRPGVPLPTAQLVGLAAELDRKAK